ncbi:FG-GAP-like repeat-containing protein [Streptomyces sp. NPDC001922]|uniref:FG-GAP-like repeat-containing protein n=1 Tax=Streptomyces sp. NPDC001922 TaxID=3364624 RepID=UPI0036A93386
MRHIRTLWATLSTAALVLAGSMALTLSAQADSVPSGSAPPLRFVSYNICGNKCGAGYDNQRRIDTVVAEASGSGWKADQIHLQEVCRTQYDAIRSRLAPKGFQGLFTETLSGDANICGGSDYGVAVLVKGPLSDTKVLDLTVGGESEPIKVPCVKSSLQGRANWACSVHLYWGEEEYRNAEARALAAQAKQWEDSGVPVVLAGDFNNRPRATALSSFYDRGINDGGQGTFTEADETDKDHFDPAACTAATRRCRSGEPTFGERKIDYVFLSSRYVKGLKGDALPLDPKVSDHRMLRAAATWADCGPSASGSGPIVRRDADGALFTHSRSADGTVSGGCKVGTGWNPMRMVARNGKDLIAVDPDGKLWRYPADAASGSYSGSTRVSVGEGWQPMNTLLAPGDFSGDGKADLIGRDSAGDLWLYKGNGAGGYQPRAKIGHGWQVYDALAAPGDFSGDGKADLIGRDSAGDLWLYKGNGAGGYQPRARIGHGWQEGELLI